jgi:hypothetical protein
MYSWFQCDRMLLLRHETVSPSSQPTDWHKKQPRDTPFLGELLCWCYLHNSVPPHILKECGKLLLIQLETLGATKITVLDVGGTNEFARPMPCSWWIVGLATSWTSPVSMWVIQRCEYQLPICEEQHETVGNHIYYSWDWPQVQNFWRGWLDLLHELWLPGHHTFETINSHASDMRLYQWDLQIMRWWRGIMAHDAIFVRLVLWARPMIFGGKGKAEISGRAGYHSHVIIYIYMY